MKHPIRRRLMYLGFQGFRLLVQALPLSAARALGRGLGASAYALLSAQRRVTAAHLNFAFGSALAPAQRAQVAREVFLNLGQNMTEWLALPKLSAAQLSSLIDAEGIAHLRTALAGGRGAIAITAHFGNWELISPYLRTLGFEGAVLARPLRYPEYESFLTEMRSARGIPTLARGSLKEVATLLRGNRVVGMLPDQDVDSLEGIFVDFFGHPAHTPVGPAALSVMTGAPIVPCFLIREGRRFRLVVERPLTAPQSNDRTEAMAALTKAWSEVVESAIRRHPGQWVWMHRRWKTQPAPAADRPHPAGKTQPALAVWLLACGLALTGAVQGCGEPKPKSDQADMGSVAASIRNPDADSQMSEFTLTGYGQSGGKQWDLTGRGATVESGIVTILQPNGTGYRVDRTTYLTAGAAQMEQNTRHVRMEHDVTVHTSDGMWLTSPVLHWIPDHNQVATESPVRIETDHMLLRGRGMEGSTELKHTTIFKDVELVLNPTEEALEAGGREQVFITCDGPLIFDYEHNIATFKENVHVRDPNGELYSDELVAYLNEGTRTIRYAEAFGNVRMNQHQNTAVSDRAVYQPEIGKITLVGKPSLLVFPAQSGQEGPQLSFGGLAGEPRP